MPVPTSPPSGERQLLRDTVRKQLRDAIIDGTLEAGERLHDEDLIAWLQVSRTPIREALGDLVRAGLIEMAPNRYTRVTNPQPEEALEAAQTLGVLYGGAVRLAVPRLNAKAQTKISSLIDKCLADISRNDSANLNTHSVDLFATYIAECGNASLMKVCADVVDGLAYKLRVPNVSDVLDWATLPQHLEELRDATRAGDPIKAELAAEAIHRLSPR